MSTKNERHILHRLLLAGVPLAAFLMIGCSQSSDTSVSVTSVERDLDSIQTTDTLRVITRNHPLTYYLYRGTRRGFEYELIQRFAEEQNIFLEVVVPPTWQDMIPYLLEGKGDIIAANMTITADREDLVAFTRPYMEVRQVLVGTEEYPPPQTLDELEDRWVVVRGGTSYEERLRELQQRGMSFGIEALNAPLDEEDPIERVANGERGLTVIDNSIGRLEQQYYPNLVIGAPLTEPQQVAWAVRPNAPELLNALDEFLQRYYRSAYFNILKRRYFDTPDRFKAHRTALLAMRTEGRISRYDEIFQEAAAETDLDWRFLAALSYHESRFHPDKRSWAGAIGLMQVMPRTAQIVGIDNLYDPVQNIHGGARYFRWIYDMYSQAASHEDRLALSLAAYNAGAGHIADARALARQRGLNPNTWEELRLVLPSFEDPEIYNQFERGYFRGRSVRKYVFDVMHRFDIFRDQVPEFVPPEVDDIMVEVFQEEMWTET